MKSARAWCLMVMMFACAGAATGAPADEGKTVAVKGRWTRVTEKAAFSPRDTADGTIFKGRMWLSNGYYHGNVLSRDLWASDDGAKWELINGATPYDGYSDIVAFKDRLWAIKGSVWSSADGTSWTQELEKTPFGARGYSDVLVHDGKLWEVGGGPDIWVSEDGVNWKELPEKAPFGPRSHMDVVWFKDRFWFMGGHDPVESTPPEKHYKNITTLNAVWTFDPATGKWEAITEHAPWAPRQWHCATVYDGKIWIIGGFDNRGDKNFGDVWYSEDGREWVEFKAEPVFSPRHEPTLYVFQDKLWVVAGNSWPVLNDVWRLDLE